MGVIVAISIHIMASIYQVSTSIPSTTSRPPSSYSSSSTSPYSNYHYYHPLISTKNMAESISHVPMAGPDKYSTIRPEIIYWEPALNHPTTPGSQLPPTLTEFHRLNHDKDSTNSDGYNNYNNIYNLPIINIGETYSAKFKHDSRETMLINPDNEKKNEISSPHLRLLPFGPNSSKTVVPGRAVPTAVTDPAIAKPLVRGPKVIFDEDFDLTFPIDSTTTKTQPTNVLSQPPSVQSVRLAQVIGPKEVRIQDILSSDRLSGATKSMLIPEEIHPVLTIIPKTIEFVARLGPS